MPKTSMTPLPLISEARTSRRSLIAGAVATLGVASIGAPAHALSASEAKSLILTVTQEVQSIINSGKSEAAMIRDFEGIFRRYGDVPRIAATLLGPPWRTASAAEQTAYVNALAGYLARKYGRQFREFVGAEITLTKTTDLGRKGVVVASTVTTDAFAPFPVEWHVIEAGGRQSFFDLIIEGVRLLSTERSEIRTILDQNRGSISALTTALRKRG